MMKDIIILDSIFILADGTLKLRDETDTFWGEYNKKTNIASKMWYKLYKNGKLKEVAEQIEEHNAVSNPEVTVIDFIVDANKISDILAENGFDNLQEYTPCMVSGCIGLNLLCYKSYRGDCGCVSSTWEHPLVVWLSNASVDKVSDTNHKGGSIAAGKHVLDLLWKEPDETETCDSCTSDDDYDDDYEIDVHVIHKYLWGNENIVDFLGFLPSKDNYYRTLDLINEYVKKLSEEEIKSIANGLRENPKNYYCSYMQINKIENA